MQNQSEANSLLVWYSPPLLPTICLMTRKRVVLQGEAHKVFWPDQPEFVKMAARFGATIIPMCAVGEDDLFEVSGRFGELYSNLNNLNG